MRKKKKIYKRYIEIRSRNNGWTKVELLTTKKGRYIIRMPDGSVIARKIGKRTRLNIGRRNPNVKKINKNWGKQYKSKKRTRKKKKLQRRVKKFGQKTKEKVDAKGRTKITQRQANKKGQS